MNKYVATPKQWADTEYWAGQDGHAQSCILELRARVEVLEANSKSTPNPSQIRSSLVERVEGALMESVKEQGSMARAAIREVAAWLIDRRRYDDWLAPFEELADLLLEEAER
jgi:hypothetical protein